MTCNIEPDTSSIVINYELMTMFLICTNKAHVLDQHNNYV